MSVLVPNKRSKNECSVLKYAEFCHFTSVVLQKRRGRNFSRVIKHMHSYFPAHLTFCLLSKGCWPSWFPKVPSDMYALQIMLGKKV